jgi:hypothetical protein
MRFLVGPDCPVGQSYRVCIFSIKKEGKKKKGMERMERMERRERRERREKEKEKKRYLATTSKQQKNLEKQGHSDEW